MRTLILVGIIMLGFTMQFRICKEADKSDAPDLTDAVKTEFDLKGKKILLAEDNDLNREIVTAILEDAGAEVTSVKDGIEAVEAAAAFDSDRKKALKTGMNGYIAKPISMEKLMEVMREVLS